MRLEMKLKARKLNVAYKEFLNSTFVVEVHKFRTRKTYGWKVKGNVSEMDKMTLRPNNNSYQSNLKQNSIYYQQNSVVYKNSVQNSVL